MKLVLAAFACALCLTLPARAGGEPLEVAAKQRGTQADVILLRGLANIFSLGMDEIARKLAAKGVEAKVMNHAAWRRAMATIVANNKARRRPVVLIGHSLGANRAVEMAQALARQRIRVDYMATFAGTRVYAVPQNVARATNFYFSVDGWGEPMRKGRGFRGRLRNVDLAKTGDVNHFTLDTNPGLQNRVVSEVLRVVKRARRAGLPLRTDEG